MKVPGERIVDHHVRRFMRPPEPVPFLPGQAQQLAGVDVIPLDEVSRPVAIAGTGVGAGFVYDGKLIMGRSVSAMELGMIYMPGTHLGSFEYGAVMLEDLTSRLALAAQAGVACYRGQLPELDRKTSGNLRDIRSKALANAFKSGDEAAMIMFRNSVRYLGMGVAGVVNLLAPDHITLGGGLVEELPGLYLNMLKEEVNRFAVPGLAKGIKYSIAKLGGDAVAAGSVAWLRQREGK